jgi:1-acyl-sn-glycerol-3-phosphate acyltransferase
VSELSPLDGAAEGAGPDGFTLTPPLADDTNRGAMEGNESMLRALLGRLRAWAKDRIDPEIEARLARVPMIRNEYGYDPFGFDPETFRYVAGLVQWIYQRYFRVEPHGVENIPEGRVLLVSNHSGQIPVDGLMIAAAAFYEGDPPRVVRSMVEKWVPQIPFVNLFMTRTGQVVGTPENCRALLRSEEAILVFPEGVRGVSKTFDKRYQLQEFGLGFMRLALESKAPIVPVAVIGAEEQAPALYNFEKLAKVIGAPAFPITPTFPFLLLLGLLPLPVKYRIYFGPPMIFDGDPNDEDAAMTHKVRAVRSKVQEMVDDGLRERQHIFW